jgi:hypothetical protein
VPLDPEINKTGDAWHVRLDGIPRGGGVDPVTGAVAPLVRYGYVITGPDPPHKYDRWHPDVLLCDPYAPLIEGRRGAFYLTLVPIRPRRRGERRSLRTFSPGVSLRPGSLAFNPDTPRRLSTPLLTPMNS